MQTRKINLSLQWAKIRRYHDEDEIELGGIRYNKKGDMGRAVYTITFKLKCWVPRYITRIIADYLLENIEIAKKQLSEASNEFYENKRDK